MTSTIEQSPLWRRTFAKSLPSVSRLVTSLRNARERVAHLTSRIVASLPGFTLHDSSHLDALWGVASTIAGDDYFLTHSKATSSGPPSFSTMPHSATRRIREDKNRKAPRGM